MRVTAWLVSILVLFATPLRADNYGAGEEDESISEGVRMAHSLMAKSDWAGAVPLLEAHMSGHYDDDETMADLAVGPRNEHRFSRHTEHSFII